MTSSLRLGADNLGCLGGDADCIPCKEHLCSPHIFQKTISESGSALKEYVKGLCPWGRTGMPGCPRAQAVPVPDPKARLCP